MLVFTAGRGVMALFGRAYLQVAAFSGGHVCRARQRFRVVGPTPPLRGSTISIGFWVDCLLHCRVWRRRSARCNLFPGGHLCQAHHLSTGEQLLLILLRIYGNSRFYWLSAALALLGRWGRLSGLSAG